MNDDFFTPERAGIDLEFEVLDKLSGAETSKIPRSYSTVDPYPFKEDPITYHYK